MITDSLAEEMKKMFMEGVGKATGRVELMVMYTDDQDGSFKIKVLPLPDRSPLMSLVEANLGIFVFAGLIKHTSLGNLVAWVSCRKYEGVIRVHFDNPDVSQANVSLLSNKHFTDKHYRLLNYLGHSLSMAYTKVFKKKRKGNGQ